MTKVEKLRAKLTSVMKITDTLIDQITAELKNENRVHNPGKNDKQAVSRKKRSNHK